MATASVEIALDPRFRHEDDRKAVWAIKAIRQATGYSLKEAKGVIDQLREDGKPSVQVDSYRVHLQKLVADLNGTGFVCQGIQIPQFEKQYGKNIRKLASLAVLSGYDGLAQDLFSLLTKYSDQNFSEKEVDIVAE